MASLRRLMAVRRNVGRGERGAQRRRNPSRAAVPADTGDDNFERREDRAVPADPLVEQQPRPADLDDSGLDLSTSSRRAGSR